MAAPDRSFSFNRNDDHTLQPGYQVSPIQAFNDPQFPPPGQRMSPPPPPVHRSAPVGMSPDRAFSQTQSQRPYGIPAAGSSNNYTDYSPPGITPGADNLGEAAAGGGINGIAIGVANTHERESGAQALRGINQTGTPFADQNSYDYPTPPRPIHPQPSYSSNAPLASGAIAPAGLLTANSSERSIPLDARPTPPLGAYPYPDSPYNRYSSSNLDLAAQRGEINPYEVADDDDDWGMGPQHQAQQQKRRSFVPFAASRNGSRESTPGSPAAGAAVGAGAGTAAYMAARDRSGAYNAVPGGSANPGSAPEPTQIKSEWLDRPSHGRKRVAWILGSIVVLAIIGGILGGILGTTLKKNKGGSDGDGSAESVAQDNKDDLSIKSDEIQKLMNNQDLHKVFPGMDYTPLNTQYPDCMHTLPSQNNVTRDMAVLSQLTNAVRLYGTDCNQTEMVLHAIDRLELTDMKVWLGVWLGDNDTTNTRQVEQMWEIIDDYGADKFKGVIIGNEVLYRKDLNETELVKYITDIKSNLTKHSIDLPVATSDLGDNWTSDMATKVDIVMSNVHPFFAGVNVSVAASWTWDFWTGHDVILTKSDPGIKQVIAEVGWPSGGGKDCGGAATCTSGSVAGIDEMNQFMEDWVCQSLANGTEYFWFEAFDEPWKVVFNEPGKEWEDKWGLMDVDRNLKNGVKIPDCGGKTAS